ncbi:MAG: aminotransferase class I/II-fold pyridoxal phosphate-dependent enzyme, partial [Verrucomicrobiaceae bacterium]|nr:aminotransferase class I/II-fold pyridoxal phosphate-dependent enzyme [Verrucomicrobiaceae bacterium]
MEISARAAQLTPSLTLSIDSKAKAMKAEGIDVCGFGAGEPDFDTPDHIKAAAIAALEAGFTKYTPSAGLPELRQAIADKLEADNQIKYRPSQIVVSSGAKHSCYNAILATCQAGDEVLIPSPYWVSYPDMVKLAGADPVIVPTTERNGWKMRASDFENAMTPRTKMLILNTPGNPTGSVYTREELEAIVEVAAEEDIYILSDEIYEKLVYDEVKHVSVASLSQEAYDLTITVNGFSKAYAMTGWRLGYLAAPEAVAKAVDSIQSHSTSNPTSFAQKGAVAALKGDQQALADMRDEFLEEDWLFEAITESYIPLLEMMQRLVRDDVPFKLTMTVTPTLCAMLHDQLLRERYVRHLDRLIDLAGREVERNRNDEQLRGLAEFYHANFS